MVSIRRAITRAATGDRHDFSWSDHVARLVRDKPWPSAELDLGSWFDPAFAAAYSFTARGDRRAGGPGSANIEPKTPPAEAGWPPAVVRTI